MILIRGLFALNPWFCIVSCQTLFQGSEEKFKEGFTLLLDNLGDGVYFLLLKVKNPHKGNDEVHMLREVGKILKKKFNSNISTINKDILLIT